MMFADVCVCVWRRCRRVLLMRTGLDASGTYQVRDLWNKKDLGNFTTSFTADAVPPHGNVMVHIH